MPAHGSTNLNITLQSILCYPPTKSIILPFFLHTSLQLIRIQVHSLFSLTYLFYLIWIIYLWVLWDGVYDQTLCSVQLSRSVVSDSLWPHGLQHARLPCPSPTPTVYSNSCPLSRWYHPTISSSVVPFSSCLQSFPASGSFQMSLFFASGGQSIGVSAPTSVFPMNIQDWFPFRLTDLISLQSKRLSRVFSNTTVQKHQFFSTQLSLYSNSHIHTWLLEKP